MSLSRRRRRRLVLETLNKKVQAESVIESHTRSEEVVLLVPEVQSEIIQIDEENIENITHSEIEDVSSVTEDKTEETSLSENEVISSKKKGKRFGKD